MLKALKEKAGYISVEAVIVAGLMIGIGMYGIIQFYLIGQLAVDDAIDRLNQVLDIKVTVTPEYPELG